MSDDDKPDWWRKARALESADRLDEAEEAIRNGIPNLYFAIATASMYRDRMIRLKAAGDTAGAEAAYKQAISFAYFYASLATSGGEGMALSGERDAFPKELEAAYGR
jgi:hypothetical protein